MNNHSSFNCISILSIHLLLFPPLRYKSKGVELKGITHWQKVMCVKRPVLVIVRCLHTSLIIAGGQDTSLTQDIVCCFKSSQSSQGLGVGLGVRVFQCRHTSILQVSNCTSGLLYLNYVQHSATWPVCVSFMTSQTRD